MTPAPPLTAVEKTIVASADRRTSFRKASATALDQATLSLVTFATGAAFIYRGTPEQYGQFTFYLSAYYLVAAAQNAIVNTPMMVLSPRMTERERTAFEQGTHGILLIGMFAAVLLVSAGAVLPTGQSGMHAADFFVVAVCCLPLMLRDFLRAQEYAHSQPAQALLRDLRYAGLALVGIGVLSLCGALRGLTAFGVLAASSLCIVWRPTWRLARAAPTPSQVAAAFRGSWKFSRWSVVGATSSWLQTNAFVFIPLLIAGTREVAFLAAARMVMMPMMLLAQSWSNYFRPHASRLLSQDGRGAALRLFSHSSFVLAGTLVVYTVAASWLLMVVPATWLPPAYHGMGIYIALWSAVTLVQVFRTNMSSLLQASLAFKRLALAGCVVAVITIVGSIPLVQVYGGKGSLIAIVGGEVLLTLLLGAQLSRIFAGSASAQEPAAVEGA